MNVKGIILIEPKIPANVGAIARSMKSFGFDNLVIVNKPERLLLRNAACISKQGKDIVENVRLVKSLKEIEGVKVGTLSAQDNLRYGLKLTDIREMEWPEEFYLVMGSEAQGLSEEDVRECDHFVTIPTNGKFGVLNLAQATTILLYEIRKSRGFLYD